MRWSISILICLGLPIVFGALPSGRTPNKRVEADCQRDSEDNSLSLTVFIEFNGDPANKFMAVEGSSFIRYDNGTTNEASCSYDGSLSDFIFVRSKVFFDGRLPENPCGVQPYSLDNNAYIWNFEIREKYSSDPLDSIYTDLDKVFHVVCSLDNSYGSFASPALGGVFTTVIDDEGDSTLIRPQNQMSVLEETSSGFVRDASAGLTRGGRAQIRVQTKTKVNGFRNIALDFYGSYVHSCDYRTSLSGPRIVFLLENGCSNFVFEDLIGGFSHAGYVPTDEINYQWFQTETNAFVLAKPSLNNNRFFLSCYVGYCFGLDSSDDRCDDFCSYSSRSRRSVNPKLDRISISVDVIDNTETLTEERKESNSQSMVIAIATSLSVIVLVAVVVIIAFVCYCRHQQQREEWTSSTTSSNLNLPQHLNVLQGKHTTI